jgi:hypothetical protein
MACLAAALSLQLAVNDTSGAWGSLIDCGQVARASAQALPMYVVPRKGKALGISKIGSAADAWTDPEG